MTGVYPSSSEADTEAVARELAAALSVLVQGDLGAGKTVFVRGLAAGLGIDGGEVSSPTFTLVHEYRGGRLILYHADLYRLDKASLEDLGLAERRVAEGVIAIEWPDRLTHRLERATTIDIAVVDDATRRISVGSR